MVAVNQASAGAVYPHTRVLPPAVGHHDSGYLAFLPRVPEEGIQLRRDGDCGQELRRHSRPEMVLQVRLGEMAPEGLVPEGPAPEARAPAMCFWVSNPLQPEALRF